MCIYISTMNTLQILLTVIHENIELYQKNNSHPEKVKNDPELVKKLVACNDIKRIIKDGSLEKDIIKYLNAQPDKPKNLVL